MLPRSKAHVLRRWAKDVGREAGAGKPLLKTIFQARRLLPRSVAPLRLVCFGKQVPDLLQHYGTTVRGP